MYCPVQTENIYVETENSQEKTVILFVLNSALVDLAEKEINIITTFFAPTLANPKVNAPQTESP